MRASVITAAVLLFAALPARATTPSISWGKPGVSFENYRADAIACARAAYDLDVGGTEAAAILRDASRKIDTIAETGVPDSGNQQSDIFPSAGAAAASTLDMSYNPAIERSIEVSHRIGRTVAAARPELQMRRVAELQAATLADCLHARGYHRFRLTRDQQHALDRLRPGKPERRRFLYDLASDPEILSAQAVD